MTSLLWDRADLKFDDYTLSKLNEWAEKHSEKCHFMEDIIAGEGFIEYYIAYEGKSHRRLFGAKCPCGAMIQMED